MNNLLEQARAKLKLTFLSYGKKVNHVSIDEIPKVWQKFGSKGDEWINVDFPESENSSGCIYIAQEGSIFDPHIHDNSAEHMTVLNVDGEMEVVTNKWTKTVKYPDSIVIDKGVPHAIIFKKETKLMTIWHPRFEKGWNAKFIKHED
tara:strand:- start:2009 stop:2449 length:441 start_codon:yes stop_codon:yes gene_type:complete